MSQLLSLGAINKLTGEYVYPKIANKKDEYICPECNKDLILCQDEIRVHRFRHQVDSINPTETQIREDAKILLKNLLERKIPISLIRNCCCCKKTKEIEIPEIIETSVIQLEYRFDFRGEHIIADVAYIDEILCIFEICTHKTCSENIYEPWYKINAETLIKMANDITLTSLQIPCVRCKKCDECYFKEQRLEFERIAKIKNEKIERINKAIESCKKSFVEEKNKLNALYTHLAFVENNIEYTECTNNIYEITKPSSKQIVKLSSKNKHPSSRQIVKSSPKHKVFVNGEWINIYFTDIFKWYYNHINNAIDNDNIKKNICH